MEINILNKSLCDMEDEGRIRLPRFLTGNSGELYVTLGEVFLSKVQETSSGLEIFAKKPNGFYEFNGLVKRIAKKIDLQEWQKIKEVLTCRTGENIQVIFQAKLFY